MPEILWEILVPCQYNSGKPVRTKHHRQWDKVVRKESGGLTLFAPAKGQWVDPTGKLYSDRVIPVRIRCNEKKMTKIARFTIGHYKQEAVFYYKVSEDSRIMFKKDL